MTSSKVRCVYLVQFVVSEISQGHDKRIVPNLADLARTVRVQVKDVLSASDVEEGRVSDSHTSKEKSGAVEALDDSHAQAGTRESFQKVPSRAVYLKRVHMLDRQTEAACARGPPSSTSASTSGLSFPVLPCQLWQLSVGWGSCWT